MQAISKISSMNFCILIHTFHRCVYLMWLVFISTVFWLLIYFLQYVRMSFRHFRVPVNFLFRSVQFQTICDEVILRYTSEGCICFLTVTFIILIIRITWIEGWFLLPLSFVCCIRNFSVGCDPSQWLYLDWARIIFLYFLLNVQIQVINLQGRYI